MPFPITWVLAVWVISQVDGHVIIQNLHSQTPYPDRLSCEYAAHEFAEQRRVYTKGQDWGYRAVCMTLEDFQGLDKTQDLTKPIF